MREYSGRAHRGRLANVLYVRASLDDLPSELGAAADALSVVLPWGGLLSAVTRPELTALRAIRGLCSRDASLDVVLALDPGRDRSEVLRLGLPSLEGAAFLGHIAPVYQAAGLRVKALRSLSREELALWPSTWARRLAHAHPRYVAHIAARAV